MKKTVKIAGILFSAFLFYGCKETPPAIDFSEKVIGLIDTTYVTSNIPNAVNKMIFVEDLTGVRCNNCPKAAAKIHEIILANPDKVVALAVYPFTLNTLMSPWTGFDTLNTQIADDIFVNFYNSPSAIPAGGVNRKIFNGESSTNISYNKWAGYADEIKTEESPIIVNAKIVSYDSITRKGRISLKVVFAKAQISPVNLTVYLTESKILSKQLMPDGSTKDDYEHNHVLRKAITNYSGEPLKIDGSTLGNYEAGRTFEKEFEVLIDSKWKSENVGFVILINKFETNNKEVLQAAEIDLK